MKLINFAHKIFSRKFWMSIAGISLGVALSLGASQSEIKIISGTVLALGSAVSYIITEGKIDLKRLQNAATAYTEGEDSNAK